MGSTAARELPPGISPPRCNFNFTDEFRFTPVPKITVPLAWERKPSTPFLARSKSHKIWKRFHSSFKSTKISHGQVGGGHDIPEIELLAEISPLANAELFRAVKKLRLSVDLDAQSESARLFLATKWEAEMSSRKRKHAIPIDMNSIRIHEITDIAAEEEPTNAAFVNPRCDSLDLDHSRGMDDKVDKDNGEGNDDASVLSFISARILQGSQGSTEAAASTDGIDLAQNKITESCQNTEDSGTESLAVVDASEEDIDDASVISSVKNIDMIQESTLIRSALELNSLDAEDAVLLNDFLLRAKAKRAANSATKSKDAETTTTEDLAFSSPPRRALEEIDRNSPSPQKPQMSTLKERKIPAKIPAGMLTLDGKGEEDEEKYATPSSYRRSTRMRLLKEEQHTICPAILQDFPIRRTTGPEFVFIQRTPAQELALTTRRNTKHNKGSAQLPKFALRALLNQQEEQDDALNADNSNNIAQAKPIRRSPRKRALRKQVTWKDERRLVEYVDAKGSGLISDVDVTADVASSGRTKKPSLTQTFSSGLPREEQGIAPVAPDATPTTPDRRLQRLRHLSVPAANRCSRVADTTSVKSIAGNTPIAKRKKLEPKSPSANLSKPPAKSAAISKAAAKTTGIGNSIKNSGKNKSNKKMNGRPVGKSQNLGQAEGGAISMPTRLRVRK